MTLAPKDIRLVRLSAGICLGAWELVRTLRRDAPPGEPDRGWREIVLQSHLFAGFPRVVEACEVLASEGGLGQPDADEIKPQGDRFDAGRELFERVYADRAGDVRSVLQIPYSIRRPLDEPVLPASRMIWSSPPISPTFAPMYFTKLDLFGPVRDCLDLFGTVWTCLDLFGYMSWKTDLTR